MYTIQMTSSTNFSIKRIYVTVLSLGLNWLTIKTILLNQVITKMIGSAVVECLTRDRDAAGSSVTALWSLSRTHLS